MTISASDIVFRKSAVVTDTTGNGGRKSQTLVVSGSRHALFPRVTKAERTSGVTRYRKEFLCNESAADEIAYDVLAYLEHPSNGGDRFYLALATQIDTQGDIATAPPTWMGCGQLNTMLAGGETTVLLNMEADDYIFPSGGYLHLTDKFATGQTIASDVSIGDSVTLIGGTWERVAASTDVEYPNGLYVGSNTVLTVQGGSNEEYISIKDYVFTDEDIGNGDGSDTSPALTNLLNGTNGIYAQTGMLPVVTATCGTVARTVNVAADGTVSGYCSAGELDMADGTWTTDITWTTAPDNLTDILITYRENPFTFSGNVATVYLDAQVANAYATVNSYGAGCVYSSTVQPTSANWVETSPAGTYDESSYPLILYNDGVEYDTWTVTFTSATAFTVSGVNAGSVGTGSISADFSPTNVDTGQPYFTISKDGWGGTWASGDTVTFLTNPSTLPLWWTELVPVATSQEPNNLVTLGWYLE